MAAVVDHGEVYRAMLEKLNEVEATKRLLEYEVQTQLLKTEELTATRKALEQEIREMEAEVEAAERAVEEKKVQFVRCQEAQLSIERSIEQETSCQATLKQELEETMTTRRQRIEELNRETCRHHCQIHEILCQVGVESTLSLHSTTDAEAQTKVDAKITSAHADIDARIVAALAQNVVTRALGKTDDAVLRSVYACFKQAKTSLQKHGDRFDSALLKTQERIHEIWPYGGNGEDPAELELKFVDHFLQAELPEDCLKAFGNPPPARELLVVSQLMKENDWICQPTGNLLGKAFLQNMPGEDVGVSIPRSSPVSDADA